MTTESSATRRNIFAYCRVSTLDQNPTMQVEAIKARYPEAIVREETASGTSMSGRPVLELLMQMVGQGDKLVVWKLDRLARNMLDLLKLVEGLEAKGASLEVLDQQIDTSTASGKAFLQMLGVFAEFETNLRRERQLAGIAKAKAEGMYKGRPETIDKDTIRLMLSEGSSHAAIAKKLGCSPKTIQRVRKEMNAEAL